MTRPRPPRIPRDLDLYDGHENYRERVRDAVSLRPETWLGVLLAFGMWYAAGRLTLVALDSGPSPDNYLAIFAYAVFGMVGFFVYLVALGFAKSKPAQRGMLAGAALTILFAASYPFARDHRLERVAEIKVDARARDEWLGELRSRGHVAEPDVVPSMIAVREKDGAWLVTNTAGRPLVVQLARVHRQRTPEGEVWQRCPLFAGRSDLDGAPRYWLPAHVSAWFEPSGFCVEHLGYDAVEYVIGDERQPPALGWRSTSALVPSEN